MKKHVTNPPKSRMKSPCEDLVLSTTQAAALLGMSAQTLAEMRAKGLGPLATYTGTRTVRYKLSDVKAYQRSMFFRRKFAAKKTQRLEYLEPNDL